MRREVVWAKKRDLCYFSYYLLKVNGESVSDLEAECSYFTFTDCVPCEQYTFLIKVFVAPFFKLNVNPSLEISPLQLLHK